MKNLEKKEQNKNNKSKKKKEKHNKKLHTQIKQIVIDQMMKIHLKIDGTEEIKFLEESIEKIMIFQKLRQV